MIGLGDGAFDIPWFTMPLEILDGHYCVTAALYCFL
jgi:hypothetical protein